MVDAIRALRGDAVNPIATFEVAWMQTGGLERLDARDDEREFLDDEWNGTVGDERREQCGLHDGAHRDVLVSLAVLIDHSECAALSGGSLDGQY